MPVLQRTNAPRGPRFYVDEGALLFVNILDSCTRDGPRPATSQDRDDHPDAYAACEAGLGDTPFRPVVSFEGNEPADEKADRDAIAANREARRKAAA